LKKIVEQNFVEVIVVPLFPQYVISTTETAIRKVYRQTKHFATFPKIKVIIPND